jgi:hypothetical protein
MLFSTLMTALGGAAGLGALITPVLVHLSSRRNATVQHNSAIIDQLQQERDAVVARIEQRDATIAALWDYLFGLRYWMVKGCVGTPPTMPAGLSVADVRARVEAARA